MKFANGKRNVAFGYIFASGCVVRIIAIKVLAMFFYNSWILVLEIIFSKLPVLTLPILPESIVNNSEISEAYGKPV